MDSKMHLSISEKKLIHLQKWCSQLVIDVSSKKIIFADFQGHEMHLQSRSQ